MSWQPLTHNWPNPLGLVSAAARHWLHGLSGFSARNGSVRPFVVLAWWSKTRALSSPTRVCKLGPVVVTPRMCLVQLFIICTWRSGVWPILALEGCVLTKPFFVCNGLFTTWTFTSLTSISLFGSHTVSCGCCLPWFKLASQMCNLLGIITAGFRCCTPRGILVRSGATEPGFLPLLKGFAHLGLVASVFDLAELGLALLVRSSARLDSPLPLADLAHPEFFPSLHGIA